MDYLTVDEVREYLRLSKSTAYLLVAQKDFPKIKIGRSIRVPKEQFEKYMKSHIYKEIEL